jgi:hypothetical protein
MQTNNFLGYYKTNGQIFTDKLSCILEAQKTLSDITWHFNDDVFQKVNWTIEPQLTLDEYYKLRAQQIRDRFDYVIVMCSGGADSTNVLYSFLNNNILVDEIVSGAPLSGLKDWNFNDKDYSASNTISETKFALFPLLKKVATNYPNIKITMNDWFEDIINYKTDEWLYASGDWISPTSACDRSLDKFKHLVDMAEQGKKIAVVYGIDKPMIRFGKDGFINFRIFDNAVSIARPPFKINYPNVERVLFYYTPELPEIMVKQCHIVSKFIHKPENKHIIQYIHELQNVPMQNFELNDLSFSITKGPPKGEYQRSIVPAIYPRTYYEDFKNIFQCKKAWGTFMSEQHGWFYELHKDTKIYEMMKSDFQLFYKNINHKYLKESGVGFKLFSNYYRIGLAANFEVVS